MKLGNNSTFNFYLIYKNICRDIIPTKGYYFLLVMIGMVVQTHAQQIDSNAQEMQGISKPNIVTSHPLGLLLYRINHSFSCAPVSKTTFNIDFGSANVWLPEVRGYLPTDPNAVEHLSHYVWHQRDSVFQGMPRNYDSMVIRADGVIKTIQLKGKFRINKEWEACIGIRSFLLTTGSDPTTIFTRDATIEDFHKYIAGGNDPFARKIYGYNKAGIYYRAPTGQPIKFSNGNFVIAGITADLMYYPDLKVLKQNNMSINAGIHLGVNTTNYNRGIDMGLSFGMIKQFLFGRNKTLSLAAAGSFMRQRFIDLGATSYFIHSKYLPAFEGMLAYKKLLQHHRFWELGLDFYCLGSYDPSEEFDKITPVGNRYTSHWHHALTHLYTNSQNWSITFAYGRKYKWMIYVNEDLKVNNAPDIQTGIGVEIPLKGKKR